MKHLRKRFILFNILVISCILVIFAILVGFSKHSTLSVNKLILAVLISMGLVLISSWLLSTVAIAPIKAAWQKQLDFTADASHELRTPLSTIQTNLDVVLSNPKATIESQMKWLENIRIENKRMSALVSDLLLLSRADTNEAIINMDNLNLSALVLEVETTFNAVAEQNKLFLSSTVEEEIFIQGDKDRIRQLLVILIDNAIKYTASNDKVNILLFRNESYATIEICDTGVGMTPEEISRVFDRFYRGKQSRLYNTDGSGLGLSIAKIITEEHGGKITAESQIGKGSIFKVSFPMSRSN